MEEVKSDSWSLFAPQAVLIAAAGGISVLCMSTVDGGWALEPLIWMSLVWYVALWLTLGKVLLRSRYTLRSLLILMTLIGIIIMFPFSAIRKGNTRAYIRSSGNVPKSDFAYSQIARSFWGWWTLPTGESIPFCLAWRIPATGERPFRDFWCTPESIVKYPDWMRREISHLQLIPWQEQPVAKQVIWPSTRADLKPMSLGIAPRNEVNNLNGLETKSGAFPTMDVSGLEKAADLSECESLNLQFCRINEKTWSDIFHPSQLVSLHLIDCEIEGLQTGIRFPALTQLSIDGIRQIDSTQITMIVGNCPRLRRLGLTPHLLSNELIRVLNERQMPLTEIELAGRGRELTLPRGLQATVCDQLILGNFLALNLSNEEIRIWVNTSNSLAIRRCRLSPEDLKALTQLDHPLYTSIVDCEVVESDLPAIIKALELPTAALSSNAKYMDWSFVEEAIKKKTGREFDLEQMRIVAE